MNLLALQPGFDAMLGGPIFSHGVLKYDLLEIRLPIHVELVLLTCLFCFVLSPSFAQLEFQFVFNDVGVPVLPLPPECF